MDKIIEHGDYKFKEVKTKERTCTGCAGDNWPTTCGILQKYCLDKNVIYKSISDKKDLGI